MIKEELERSEYNETKSDLNQSEAPRPETGLENSITALEEKLNRTREQVK